MSLAGIKATWYEQIGFSLADVVAKAVFGILIGAIASVKHTLVEDDLDLCVRWFWWSFAMFPFAIMRRPAAAASGCRCQLNGT